jgi:choline transport protein
MALVSEYKTTDLDLVEHGSGSGENPGDTPMELQSVGDHHSSGLDVSF